MPSLRFAILERRQMPSDDGLSGLVDQDLKTGVATLEDVDVVAAVEVEEYDDEGAGFLLEFTDGRVLFLVGQHLYPYSLDADPEVRADLESDTFPSDHLTISYAPKSRIVLDTKGTGIYLRPRARARWQGKGPRADPYLGPIPDSIEEGPLEEVLARAGLFQKPI